MFDIIVRVNRVVWGVPTLLLILTVGFVLCIRTRFAQFTLFPRAIGLFLKKLLGRKADHKGVSSYSALCTALAATVGTGNLVGVAGAICIGGPGAIFWMWICALLGMVIKFAEAVLAVKYRQRNTSGECVGGPMYMIQNGMGHKWSWLGAVYCFFGVVAAFGVGNATQINAVIGGIDSAVASFGVEISYEGRIVIAVLLSATILFMLIGGARRIGKTAEKLVPFASVCYILMCLGVVCVRLESVPSALSSIVHGAFSPEAVTGGLVGSAIQAVRIGASRGIFTNEAGMGTAAIAHGSADVEHPVEQGMMGIVEVFLDTIVICSLTAIVILCSGVPVNYGFDEGVALTARAFSEIYGQWITIPLSIEICCFAFATILGWGLYGARCAQFLFGVNTWKVFALIQALVVVAGALLQTKTVWILSETVNGLMAIPNLIALLSLRNELSYITKDYKAKRFIASANGGTYENFNQCQSMRAVTNAEIPSIGGECTKARKADISLKHRSA